MPLQSSGPATHSIFRKIRVSKENTAFVYFLLESYEGIASYSTLPSAAGDAYRDLELRVPPDFQEEVNRLLLSLGEMVHEL